nr:hypothetical protein [Escherichia coli]
MPELFSRILLRSFSLTRFTSAISFLSLRAALLPYQDEFGLIIRCVEQ